MTCFAEVPAGDTVVMRGEQGNPVAHLQFKHFKDESNGNIRDKWIVATRLKLAKHCHSPETYLSVFIL